MVLFAALHIGKVLDSPVGAKGPSGHYVARGNLEVLTALRTCSGREACRQMFLRQLRSDGSSSITEEAVTPNAHATAWGPCTHPNSPWVDSPTPIRHHFNGFRVNCGPRKTSENRKALQHPGSPPSCTAMYCA